MNDEIKLTLMNKNTKVLDFTYNILNGVISNIENIYNLDYAPFSISCSDNILSSLDYWLDKRIKISNRFYERYDYILIEKKIKKEIISCSNLLSLSDTYWINHKNDLKEWKDINYFNNNFSQLEIGEYSSRDFNAYDKVSDLIYSPTTTTGGQLDKAWIIDKNNVRCLLKTTNTFQMMEPINEAFASTLCNIIGLQSANYSLKYIKNKTILTSCCPCFTSEDKELVSASDLIDIKSSFTDTVDSYKSKLDSLKIPDASSNIDKMLLLDTLLISSDRHLDYFGVIRDVNNLKWLSTAPIYDNGRTFGTTYSGYDFINYSEKDFDYFVFGLKTTRYELINYLKGRITISSEVGHSLINSLDDLDILLKNNRVYIRVNEEQRHHLISLLHNHFDYVISNLK